MTPIDLHTHTSASDGTDTPETLIHMALDIGLSALAITDHDTIDGYLEARNHVDPQHLRLISGIEFSTTEVGLGFDIHILGYGFDPEDMDFNQSLKAIRHSRNLRNVAILEKLNTIGFHITMDDVKALSDDGVITRAHIGRCLKLKGYIKKEQDAYDYYIGNGCVAYVPRKALTPKMAIDILLKAGGIPVLAHPLLCPLTIDALKTMILKLKKEGLMGIEGIYALHSEADERLLKKFAKENQLLITGGSDYHGDNKPHIRLGKGLGNLYIPDRVLEPLIEAGLKIP